MKPERLARRWKRRHLGLLAELEKQLHLTRRRGDAEAVHALRVALRRLRLSLRLGKALFGEELRAKWRTWARKVSTVTSPVRDLDIAVEWLLANRANPALIQEAQHLRERAWRRHRRQITAPPRGLLARLHRPVRSDKGLRTLVQRLERLEARYREHLQARLPQFFELGEEERHDFRRTVRWWRYLRELTFPRKKLKRDRVYRHLLSVQEILGDLQNLTLVQKALDRLTDSPELTEMRTLLTRQQQAQLDLARAALRGLRTALK